MTGRSIRFIPTAATAKSPEPGMEQIVVDTAWTAPSGGGDGLRGLRPIVAGVLRDHQPLADSMAAIDRWAAAGGLVDLMTVAGTSHWYRRRIYYWRWLQERSIWIHVLRHLADGEPIEHVFVPADEPELVEMARLIADRANWSVEVAPAAMPTAPGGARAARSGASPSIVERAIRRLVSTTRVGGSDRGVAVAARERELADRVRRLATRSRLLVLADPAIYQVITGRDGSARADPFIGPVVGALSSTPLDPVVLELGSSHGQAATWASLQAPGRGSVLPGSVISALFADPGDDAVAAAEAAAVGARLAAPLPGLEVAGLDLGPTIAADIRRFARDDLSSGLRATRRIGRFLRALHPAGILLINEYSRPEWIEAAHLAGIPIAAVQHGIIHRWHAGYLLPARTTAMPLVDRTYVFGAFEKRLLTRQSAYRPSEVIVAGSPRLDLVGPSSNDAVLRRAVRAELGVAEAARLVVLSSTSSVDARRFVLAAALDGMLDRELAGVHLVIKLHPAEDDGAFYRRLVEGLAAVRHFPPPPLSIVGSMDLYRLLRAADAHVGVYSTVLTDAVAAGTRNLVVTSQAGPDLLDYVAAGVARPLRDGGDLMTALEDPGDVERAAAARTAFLADHYEPGASATRIAADLIGFMARGPTRTGAGSSVAGTGPAADRAFGATSGPPIALRPVNPADADVLMAWANEPAVRAMSFRVAPIEQVEHQAWLSARLADPRCRLWIGIDPDHGDPIGVIRFELGDDDWATVSITIDGDERGRGLGRRLLVAGLTEAGVALQPVGFRAWTRADNARSIGLFLGAGFGRGVVAEDRLEFVLRSDRASGSN